MIKAFKADQRNKNQGINNQYPEQKGALAIETTDIRKNTKVYYELYSKKLENLGKINPQENYNIPN